MHRNSVEVHAHECHELQKSRIDAAQRAGVTQRHGTDQVLLEPADRLVGRELVDPGRGDPAIDRCRHQGETGGGRGMVVLGHERYGSERCDARLADRHQVSARPDHPEKPHQVVDVLVEAKAARGDRHIARCASR
jgi:hypothetical protein